VATIEELIVHTIQQRPPCTEAFHYVDIRSIDTATKRIADPKSLQMSEAPSRARQQLRTSDVLVSMTRPNLNAVAMVPQNLDGAIGSTGFHVLRSPETASWLFYAVQTEAFVSVMSSRVQGVMYPAIRPRDVLQYELPVPPLAEQRRIVAEIEKHLTRLDTATTSLRHVAGALRRYRAAILQSACEGRLVRTGASLSVTNEQVPETAAEFRCRLIRQRSRSRQPASRHQPAHATLPEGWVWAYLAELGELNRGKSRHRPRNDPRLLDGPYPFIQTADIRRADGHIRAYSQTYSELGLAQSRLWPAGTLCITIAANIAETGILTFPACFPDSVVGFLLENEPTTVRYLELFLRTAQGNLERFAPATAQKNINLETLYDLAIPLPSPSEQQRIVTEIDRRLSVIQELEQSVNANLRRAYRLRQSILKRAFEGKLVPQDPTDEPASVLLDRIQTERRASPTVARRSRRARAYPLFEPVVQTAET